MKFKRSVIFEGKEDMDLLRAVVALIGKHSDTSKQMLNLSIRERELCSLFYDELHVFLEDEAEK